MAEAYKFYQEKQVQTLSQPKLVLMLYEGAIRFCREAALALERHDYARVSDRIGRAQEIVSELIVTLDHEAGGVANNLHQLYDFIYRWLIQANVKKSPQHIADVIRLLEELRNTWEEATSRYYSQGAGIAAGGLNFKR